MTLEEAIEKSIRSFLDGAENEKLSQVKPSKYSKKYFDEAEERVLGPTKTAQTDKKAK